MCSCSSGIRIYLAYIAVALCPEAGQGLARVASLVFSADSSSGNCLLVAILMLVP